MNVRAVLPLFLAAALTQAAHADFVQIPDSAECSSLRGARLTLTFQGKEDCPFLAKAADCRYVAPQALTVPQETNVLYFQKTGRLDREMVEKPDLDRDFCKVELKKTLVAGAAFANHRDMKVLFAADGPSDMDPGLRTLVLTVQDPTVKTVVCHFRDGKKRAARPTRISDLGDIISGAMAARDVLENVAPAKSDNSSDAAAAVQ